MTDLWAKLGISLVSLLIGTALGNWLAIGRDNRNHFRIATDPSRQQIVNALENERYWQALRDDPLDKARHVLSRRKRAALRKLETDFKALRAKAVQYDQYGVWIPPSQKSEQEAKELLEKILNFLSRPWWKPW